LDDEQDGEWMSVSSGTDSPRESRTTGRKTVVVVAAVLHAALKVPQISVPE